MGEFLSLKYAKAWVEKNRLLTDDPNYIKKKRKKVDPNAPDNEQDQEMNQALVLKVEPALVAEVNETLLESNTQMNAAYQLVLRNSNSWMEAHYSSLNCHIQDFFIGDSKI